MKAQAKKEEPAKAEAKEIKAEEPAKQKQEVKKEELKKKAEHRKKLDKEKRQMQAVLEIKKKFGKNTLLRGMDFGEKARTAERNNQIGGHKA